MIIPGLHKRHLVILGLCAYTLQAIATADGAFKLNHALFFAVGKNGQAGWVRTLSWMNTSADAIDRWSIDRWGKDPWIVQGEMIARYSASCVTTPKPGIGYLSRATISLYHSSSKKDIKTLGTPFCKSVSGNLAYLTPNPDQMFEVNPRNPKEYGTVNVNH